MSKLRVYVIGAAILVTGVGIGVAGAQVAQALLQPSFLNTGLFSVRPGERARFFVSLDDREDGQRDHQLEEGEATVASWIGHRPLPQSVR